MARPRYRISSQDWLDCLDWFEYQTHQRQWLLQPEHPIHEMGISSIQQSIAQWRQVEKPTNEMLRKLQQLLDHSITEEDRARYRKALSAKKRRRREQRLQIKPVNITLTTEAHRDLVEYKKLTGIKTLSEAVESGLKSALYELNKQKENEQSQQLLTQLSRYTPKELTKYTLRYLNCCTQQRTLANSCKVAFDLFKQSPNRNSAQLLIERLVEDLVWNNVHLGVTVESLNLSGS